MFLNNAHTHTCTDTYSSAQNGLGNDDINTLKMSKCAINNMGRILHTIQVTHPSCQSIDCS